eukprot:3455779-Rhodomonas_salina.1
MCLGIWIWIGGPVGRAGAPGNLQQREREHGRGGRGGREGREESDGREGGDGEEREGGYIRHALTYPQP